MTKALGFLTGVCLTVAAFVLLLDRSHIQGEEKRALVSVATEVRPVDVMPGPAEKVLTTDTAKPKSNAGTKIDNAAAMTSSVDETAPTDSAHAVSNTYEPVTVSQPFEPADRKQQTNSAMPVANVQRVGDAVKPSENPEPLALERLSRPHVFWSPFRSEWAAKGFARRLTYATQIPIEVVKEGADEFRVSFDYQNENQCLAYIERIESIPGLQLE